MTLLDQYNQNYSHLTASQWHTQLGNAIEQINIAKDRGEIASIKDLLPSTTASGSTKHDKSSLPLILDIRNKYEWEMGSFENALPIDVDAFRGTFSQLETMLGLESLTPDVLDLQKSRVIASFAHIQDVNRREKVIQEALESFAQLRVRSTEEETLQQSSVPQPADHFDRPIYLYCTGGIRCVSTGAFLSSRGFNNVNVLEGGINSYLQHVTSATSATPGSEHGFEPGAQTDLIAAAPEQGTGSEKMETTKSLFQGVNTVFDNRMIVPGDDVVSVCQQCGTSSSRLNNCAYNVCNSLLVSCAACSNAYAHCCSVECAGLLYQVDVLPQVHQRLANIKGDPTHHPRPVMTMPKKTSVRSRIDHISPRKK